ncbi:hypothetical protein H6F43_02725 [Leptolyngbya sp. FACHB-36]|uniref:hypothetical protein n=1 Tax=Leptolyngbya sp. FACHB-36 TaxID=2692808 RepID=UPI0016817939|nr:hypothetical protein [Leptolyngbya sp. FACHB-36]MBD2019099.1 hypothetical protein [Leptolyngbya sp. FACHB-36]
MLALSQTQSLAATSSQVEPCGFDNGNGAVKLALPSGEIRCPAYILPIHELLRDRPVNGFVDYLEGDRADLANQLWMSGVAVYRHSPLAHLKTVDSVTGKLDWGCNSCSGHCPTCRIARCGIWRWWQASTMLKRSVLL